MSIPNNTQTTTIYKFSVDFTNAEPCFTMDRIPVVKHPTCYTLATNSRRRFPLSSIGKVTSECNEVSVLLEQNDRSKAVSLLTDNFNSRLEAVQHVYDSIKRQKDRFVKVSKGGASR